MEPIIFVYILIGIILLFILLSNPLKFFRFLGRGFVKIIIGVLMLFFLNVIGNHFDIYVPINLVSSLVSGFLGIPGIAALVVINKWIL